MLVLYILVSVFGSLNSELIFAQLWFRHGSRAPTVYMRFPSEPSDYGKDFPYEKGELTKEGKLMEYQLGKRLRKEFDGFLSPNYIPHENMVYIDEDNRTSDSAALMLAALYPPSESEIWNPELLWNPVALHQDNILVKAGMALSYNCPKIGARVAERDEFWAILDTNPEMIQELEKATGVQMTRPKDLSDVLDEYWTRYKLADSRLPVPSWLDDAMGKKIRLFQDDITTQFFSIPEVMNSIGAWHTTRIIAEIDFVLSQPIEKRRKITFFSGHDTNLLIMGKRLGIPHCGEHFSDYGGSMAIELHSQSNILYLKFFYSDAYDTPRTEVFSTSCGQNCTYKRFKELFSKPKVDDSKFWSLCKEAPIGNRNTPFIITLVAIVVVLLITNAVTCVKLVGKSKRSSTISIEDEREPLIFKDSPI